MASMQRSDSSQPATLARLVREPTLHFFLIAALALLVQRLFLGDSRTIVLKAPLKADLIRRYEDQIGRPPTKAESDALIASWKVDEALYREAIRERIDRDDPAVRTLLAGKVRDRLSLQTRIPEPSEAELQQYLEQNRSQFESPLVYEYTWVSFPKQDPGAAQLRAKYEAPLAAGATPASLGLQNGAANVDRERMDQDFGAQVAEQIRNLTIGRWQELETGDRLLLVKLIRIQGGLPEPEMLHEQLVALWKGAAAQKALAQATQAIAARYRFEEAP